MSPTVRPATQADIPAMVQLLLEDGARRATLNPALWPVAPDTPARIEHAIASSLDAANPAQRALWLVAESSGHLVGITHAMIAQPPPIYDVPGSPGLMLDDCFTRADAPPDTAEQLLLATEAALRAAGAAALIASVPAYGSWRPLYARHGYDPVTLYMAKTGFSDRAVRPDVRPAQAADIPGLVQRSTEHRKTLQALNGRFWHIHPEADRRFELWMRYSLTLKDRDMFVAGSSGEVDGYVIAQPIAPLLMPAAHDLGTTGVIDDFYDIDFADVATIAHKGTTAVDLLSAAESAFALRGFASALAVCPAAWTSKATLLEGAGYRTAKLWLLKR